MVRRPAIALVLVLGACATGDTVVSDTTVPDAPPPTVGGVGRLPETIPVPNVVADVITDGGSDDASDSGERGSAADRIALPPDFQIARPVDDEGALLDTVAEQVQGNRLLAIGDSILASTATRYGGEICAALNPLGWSVEVDAEPSRFVEFGNEVLAERLPLEEVIPEDEDFDAAIVHLGSNYGEDREVYFQQLNEILFHLAPRPTLLMKVTEYRPQWSEVNEVIDELAGLYDNVTVIDWEAVSTYPGVLGRDGLHPGEQGEAVLVELLAVALGRVADEPGECLPSAFTDDSEVEGGSGPVFDPDDSGGG